MCGGWSCVAQLGSTPGHSGQRSGRAAVRRPRPRPHHRHQLSWSWTLRSPDTHQHRFYGPHSSWKTFSISSFCEHKHAEIYNTRIFSCIHENVVSKGGQVPHSFCPETKLLQNNCPLALVGVRVATQRSLLSLSSLDWWPTSLLATLCWILKHKVHVGWVQCVLTKHVSIIHTCPYQLSVSQVLSALHF